MIRRRKSETVRLRNERDFPHLVELALPTKDFRDIVQEIAAFHREQRVPVRRGRNRHEVKQFYIRFCFPNAAIANAFRNRFAGECLTHAPEGGRRLRPHARVNPYRVVREQRLIPSPIDQNSCAH